MSWKEDVKARFSQKEAASKWDLMYEKDTASLEEENFRLRRDYTVDYIVNNFDKTVSICDLGCGAGPVTYEMLKRGYNIVGLDYSFDMLQNAKRRLIAGGITGRPLINSNGETLPFQDEMFDCVVCLGVISYVENYENIIKEIFRILKPGGTVLISFRNKYNLIANDPIALLKLLVKTALVTLRLRERDKFRIGHYMVARDVVRLVNSNGFVFEKFKGIGFGPYSFWHKKLFDEDTSIRISSFITRLADVLRAGFVFKLASDVKILIFRKDFGRQGIMPIT